VPIGVALVVPALMALAGAGARRRQALDLVGAVTGTAGLATSVYGVMQTADHGWGSVRVLGPVLAGLLLTVVFVLVEARVAGQPMMPLRSLRIRGVAVSNVMLLLFGAIAIAMWFFTSLFMQNVLGYSALQAGLGQTPAAVVFVVVARSAAAWLWHTGVQVLVLAGCACFAAGFGWLARAEAGSSFAASMLGPTLLVAVGIGLVFPTLMASATAEVSADDAGIVAGLANTASQVGGALALATFATAASAKAAATAKAAAVGPAHGPAALAAGYGLVFLLAVGVAVAIAALSLLLPRHRRI
jgi:MFS family permease